MPIGIELVLLITAFICAVLSLVGKAPAGVGVLLVCVAELVRLAGH